MRLRVAKKIDGHFTTEELQRYFSAYKGSTRSKAVARMRRYWNRDPWLDAPLTEEEQAEFAQAYESLVAESP